MYQLKNSRLVLIYFLMVFISCQCNRLNSEDDNFEDNQIEFYQKVNRKVLTTTTKPPVKFSIFHKRTRPLFRRNNKYQTFLTSYKIVSNSSEDPNLAPEHQVKFNKRLNKSKTKFEFVDIDDRTKQSITNLDIDRNNSDKSNRIDSLSHAQQTVLAFEHALKMKKEAKCDLPKPTVVYLNQDKEQIKVYMPRATILHRCGQNTGCCELESEHCVAVEQEQVNLYFFVIKFEQDFDTNLHNDFDSDSVRKGRKFLSVDQNDDDSMIKEYEYNLDYTLNNENENSFKLNDNYDLDSKEMKLLNQLKNENHYLNTLLNQDNQLKRRLIRSPKFLKKRRKSKDLIIESIDSDEDNKSFKRMPNISVLKRNLSESDGESSDVIDNNNNSENSQSKKGNFEKAQSLLRYSTQQITSNKNHIRRSLSNSQMRPKQTIEMLTFTNHTRCSCVNRLK